MDGVFVPLRRIVVGKSFLANGTRVSFVHFPPVLHDSLPIRKSLVAFGADAILPIHFLFNGRIFGLVLLSPVPA